jgi:nitrite reductase (NADH) small subunit/3-phenylpropionate/trans-cinnamate dioxygenase ferredoxin subunit
MKFVLERLVAEVDEPPADDEFQTVAMVGSIPEGEGRAFPVNGRLIAVFLRDGTYYAINDCCPHMGASLSTGYVDGDDVVCPWHAWKFCIKDGLWMDNPRSKVRTETFPVRIIDNQIQVGKNAAQ